MLIYEGVLCSPWNGEQQGWEDIWFVQRVWTKNKSRYVLKNNRLVKEKQQAYDF